MISRARNVDQLRHEIDSGNTGDKVKALEPAAAPLGTDEEAAGTPISAEAVTIAYRAEVSHPEHDRTANPSKWKGVAAIAVAASFAGVIILWIMSA